MRRRGYVPNAVRPTILNSVVSVFRLTTRQHTGIFCGREPDCAVGRIVGDPLQAIPTEGGALGVCDGRNGLGFLAQGVINLNPQKVIYAFLVDTYQLLNRGGSVPHHAGS
jgi:hypothetical protein